MAATEQQLLAHENAVRKHVRLVRKNGRLLIKEFQERLKIHDASKLQEPEASIYAEHGDKLGKTEYGTPEYEKLLELVKPAIEHHWAVNRHHIPHWPHGIDDFDLVDLMELLSDWVASTKKGLNGNPHKSVEINVKKYNISPQLASILTNTIERYLS